MKFEADDGTQIEEDAVALAQRPADLEGQPKHGRHGLELFTNTTVRTVRAYRIAALAGFQTNPEAALTTAPFGQLHSRLPASGIAQLLLRFPRATGKQRAYLHTDRKLRRNQSNKAVAECEDDRAVHGP